MPSVYRQIEIDIMLAWKENLLEERDLLRVVRGEFDRIGNHISDEDAIKIIHKMYNNALDLKNEGEAKILKEYLPRMLEPKEIKVIISNIIEVNGYTRMQDFGLIMSKLKMNEERLSIDMKIANIIIKEILK